MPRQDVPYGGAICRLKERITEIWDKLDQKLHSINGVEGDGAGNVEIVSGDAAVVINNDQVGHRIEVSLDSSKLPSAAVSSVNYKTGDVVLTASDIEDTHNDDSVQNTINGLLIDDADLRDKINNEAQARQAADAALQGNINSVQASIPGAAAAAVSNDPTVAQLAVDVPGKLDKISSGSNLKAYTHTGQSQGETAVVNGVDANSIGLRDANGRMQAADPAAGATDKTLVTANWVSQTGDGAPNNVAHKNGNETWLGLKTIPEINLNYLRATTVNTNSKTIILYDLGRNAESTYSFQVCIECVGRAHWRQLYIQIYKDHSVVRGQNVIAGGDEGLKVIRGLLDNHTYIGISTIQNEFPDVQIKYCQYRATLSPFNKTIVDITGNTNYTVENIPAS